MTIAALWVDASNVAIRIGTTDDLDPPSVFSNVLEFDIASNQALWNDINNTFDTAVWTYSSNVLRKDGVAQTVNAPTDSNAFSAGYNRAVNDLQTISTATFSNNAQRDNAIRRLAEIELAVVKRLAILLRGN